MLQTKFQDYLKQFLPNISWVSAQAVLELHKQGATVPFIARYRKEKTNNLDEVAVRNVLDANEIYNEFIQRQAFILKEVESQGNLTPELKKQIHSTLDIDELEEIYRPFKKKKKTKAVLAREAGIEPLADWLWGLGQGTVADTTALEVKAKDYINPKALFATYQETLKGAENILIDRLMYNQDLRNFVRNHLQQSGKIVSKKGKKYKSHSKFEIYTNFEEPIKRLFDPKASHRYMAMRRGWTEGELSITIEGQNNILTDKFKELVIKKQNTQAQSFLEEMIKNAIELHIMPSITNEIHKKLKDTADGHAIEVFAKNVTKILLASPFGAKCVLGIDPGLRTGAKVSLVNTDGSYVSHTILKINDPNAEPETEKLFKDLFASIKVDAIAVGNGTAGRETEVFIRKILKKLGSTVPVVLVNESGASIYSASEVAREEFPDLDLTIRGAISIARRLQDPLAELVKIDPQSIGVGQYQHDVPPTRLKKALDAVVESCVHLVGIDLNTASAYLLQYISGIGPSIAKNIVEYRKSNGLFKDRDDLLKIKQFSSKIFEQSAGFLRIRGGTNILDQTGIHPENYSAVRQMSQDAGCSISELIKGNASKLLEKKDKWDTLVGEFTFKDIIKELESPGRDPRDVFKVFSFRDDIFEIKDLKENMICPGIVTNVTNFGAFVDVGVHQDGLVHISELTHAFVDDPRQVVNPGDQVEVKVLKIDLEKKQVFLTMKLQPAPVKERQARPQREKRDEPRRSKPDRQSPRQDPKAIVPPKPVHPKAAFLGKKSLMESDKSNPQKKVHHQSHKSQHHGGNRSAHNNKQKGPPLNNPFAVLANLKTQLKK